MAVDAARLTGLTVPTVTDAVVQVLALASPPKILKPVVVGHIVGMKAMLPRRRRADERLENLPVDRDVPMPPVLREPHRHVSGLPFGATLRKPPGTRCVTP